MNEEIHIKIAGDQGGGSFKEILEVLNTACPNSKQNTSIVGMMEAKDYRANLKISVGFFKEQIDEIQKLTWQ